MLSLRRTLRERLDTFGRVVVERRISDLGISAPPTSAQIARGSDPASLIACSNGFPAVANRCRATCDTSGESNPRCHHVATLDTTVSGHIEGAGRVFRSRDYPEGLPRRMIPRRRPVLSSEAAIF